MPKQFLLNASMFAFCVGLASQAMAAPTQVYSGCATPPTQSTGHVFYVDPVNGSEKGDGSEAKPWHSLQAVVSSVSGAAPLLSTVSYWHRGSGGWNWDNSNAPVKPGDTIRLMSGNYGNVSIGIYGHPINNSEFVTIEAAPGQTPVLTSLNVNNGTTKMLFSGLTFEGERVSGDYLPRVSLSGNDLIVTKSHILSAPDLSKWTRDQWMTEASWMGVRLDGTCTSFTDNLVENIVLGVGIGGTNILFANNTIQYFGMDAIDVATATNLLISKNKILDHIGVNDGPANWHTDAIQIFGTDANIVVDSNYIVRQTKADLPWPGKEANLPSEMQGIDDFGFTAGTGVVVTNNVVITDSYQGINFSMPGTQIINNTVLSDTPSQPNVWISGGGKGTVIRNNIASAINIGDPLVNVDHNLANYLMALFDQKTQKEVYYKAQYMTRKTAGDHNIFDQNNFTTVFVKYDPVHFTYNLNLRVPVFDQSGLGTDGDVAFGAGNSVGAPALDITGATRTAPYDMGAYKAVIPVKAAAPDVAPTVTAKRTIN